MNGAQFIPPPLKLTRIDNKEAVSFTVNESDSYVLEVITHSCTYRYECDL
jgi:hypothetical protein